MGDLAQLNSLNDRSAGDIMSLLQPSGGGIAAFIAGSIFGLIGFFAFLNGKKHASGWRMVIGIALMVYPYVVPGLLWTCVVGIGLTTALYFTRD